MARDEEGIAGLLIGGAAVAAAIYGLAKYDSRKTQERKNTPIKYPKGLNDDIFKELCIESAKGIKRLKIIEVIGLEIKCSVKSSSGLSIWNFSGDFYDYGNLTGKYWLYSDNDDSTIPELFMSKVVSKIQDVIIENSVRPPKSFTGIVGVRIFDAKKMFVQAGFNRVRVKSTKKPFYSFLAKKGSVYKVSINGIEDFNEDRMFDPESEVCIYFYDL
ncbi:hypothetical protein [Vagococcus fluvialis]|uniref:hypothetical protein n=1 Tax=Vagococcus fluvialis TaxID=2738 RepID=UPI001A8FFBEA|nr:hypothetical protein [Vagococcus fluvialis]MBO0443665.1 hypothetical protein [Vagococcus fluvialis]MDT2782353.1 hypothetical protein [Vagococcus fluvialis]UDM75067.1 hypothetical protein K5K99_05695 [Vagococcus fluvialis]